LFSIVKKSQLACYWGPVFTRNWNKQTRYWQMF